MNPAILQVVYMLLSATQAITELRAIRKRMEAEGEVSPELRSEIITRIQNAEAAMQSAMGSE